MRVQELQVVAERPQRLEEEEVVVVESRQEREEAVVVVERPQRLEEEEEEEEEEEDEAGLGRQEEQRLRPEVVEVQIVDGDLPDAETMMR